jgi:membrane protease YdiL (CAAX protease family)
MSDRSIRVNVICAVSSLKWLAGFLVASYLWGWGLHLLVRWAGVDLPAVRHLATGFMALLGYAWILKRSAVHRTTGPRLGASGHWVLAAGVIGLGYVACVLVLMAWLAPPIALRMASHASFANLTLLLAGAVIEEVVYRGLLLASLSRCLPALLANVTQAAAFALMHFVGVGRSVHVPGDMLATFFIVGLLAGSLCLASRSLLPGALFHMASNLVVVSLPFTDASALGGWGVASGWQMDVGPAGPAWMKWIEAAFCIAVMLALELHRRKARRVPSTSGLPPAAG